jgi:uncharacterized protein YegL
MSTEAEADPTAQVNNEQGFFQEEERMLTDFAQIGSFVFKRGKGWAINPENGEATYDPSFFTEKGYSQAQALFASAHEVEHVRQLAELLNQEGGSDYWEEVKERHGQNKRYAILANCVDDVADNRRLLSVLPSLRTETVRLYQERLCPEVDLTDKPMHLQLAYAILREGMLPEEQVVVKNQVRSALDRLQAVSGKSGQTRNVIAMVTDPRTDHLSRMRLVERYIEPELDALYQQDLENKKDQSQEGGKPTEGENSFASHYDEYEQNNPQPITEKDKEKAIKERKEHIESEAERQQSGYSEEHGVTREDIAEYYQEYKKIEGFIEPLREIFYRIVEERRIPVKALSKLTEEGVMLEPGLVGQAYADIESGVEAPKVMRDFEGQEIVENIPGRFRIRLVGDLSVSMNGEKLKVQRQTAQLVLEALKEFSDLLDENRAALSVDLDIQSEVVTFGTGDLTKVVKPLSKELTEKQRIEAFKALSKTGGSTNDFDALRIIEDEIRAEVAENPQYVSDLRRDKVREIVIVFSDGASDNAGMVQTKLETLRGMGVKVIGVGITNEAKSILSTYAPDAQVCSDASQLPKTLQELLADQFSTLSFTTLPPELLVKAKEV